MHGPPSAGGGASPAPAAPAGAAAVSHGLALDQARPQERGGGGGGLEGGEDAPGVDARGSSPPDDVEAAARALAQRECCARHCLRAPGSTGAAAAAEPSESARHLAASLARMSKAEKKVCLFTALSISSLVKPRPQRAPRPRADGVRARQRFAYWLPLVGEVCRAAFMDAFGVSPCSLSRYRQQLALERRLSPAPHGNARNANAKVLDDEQLARWLRALAAREGRSVARRVRVRRMESGRRVSATEERRHVELPARYTWERLLREFEAAHPSGDGERRLRAVRPSLSSFRRILRAKCPEIEVSGGGGSHAANGQPDTGVDASARRID